MNTLESNVNINISDISNSKTRYGNIQSKGSKQVYSGTLSKRLIINLFKAKKTVTVTTQHGVWSCLHPALGRQYPTNENILCYNHMPDPVFSDTLKSGTKSKRGNLYGQSYCTSYGWRRCHPMQNKIEAHDTLSIIFKCDGVPAKMVVDNSKEQYLGGFTSKCREAECHSVQNEPFSTWS